MEKVKDEFADRPVPREARLGFWPPAVTVAGFGYAYVCIYIGSGIYAGLGAPAAYTAAIAGALFLFTYSSFIAVKSSQYGYNLPLQCKATFGRYGYVIPALLLAGLVNGWFTFQAWLAADLFCGLYGYEWYSGAAGGGMAPGGLAGFGNILGPTGTTWFWTIIFAAIFGLFAIYGIKWMYYFARFAIIAITGLVIWMVYTVLDAVFVQGINLMSRPPIGPEIPWALGMTMSVGTFVNSSTMTGDFNRWTKSTKEALGVTAVWFLGTNNAMVVMGCLYSAAALKLDWFYGLATVGAGIPIMVMQWASNGTTCDSCLYNSTNGYVNVFQGLGGRGRWFTWKRASAIGMLGGIIVGASGIMSSLVGWLTTLCVFVPTVGGVIIGHFWIVARHLNDEEMLALTTKKVNTPALVSFAGAVATAYYMAFMTPELTPAIAGIIWGVIVYPILWKVSRAKLLPEGFKPSKPSEPAAAPKVSKVASVILDEALTDLLPSRRINYAKI
ncbi:MAG: cytosine permease [Candidatus Bathyarchaeia archaeon]